MKRTLLFCMVTLIGMTALPSYGQEQEENSETPIVINSLDELNSIESGTLVKITMDSLFCNYSRPSSSYLHDKSGVVIIAGKTLNKGYYYNCDVTGQLTKENGLPEITGMEGTLTGLDPEDEYFWYYEEYKEITTNEYWDNLGNCVSMTLDHEDYIIEDVMGNHFFNTEQKSFNTQNYKITVSGIAQPTGDGKKRIVLTESISLDVYLSDEEGIKESLPRIRVHVDRLIQGGKWNTVCVPYALNPDLLGTCAIFDSVGDGVLYFNKTRKEIPACTPFLLKPFAKSGVTSLRGSDWMLLKPVSPRSKNGGDYTFVGTMKPVKPIDGSYYLSEGNTIKPFAPGGTIKGFRAYFKPNFASARARAISIDGTTTAIEDIEWGDGNPFLAPTDNRIYNLEGQMVGNDLNQLPKGMYIINGKKVIK